VVIDEIQCALPCAGRGPVIRDREAEVCPIWSRELNRSAKKS